MVFVVPTTGRSSGAHACGEAAWGAGQQGLAAARRVAEQGLAAQTLPGKRAVNYSVMRSSDHPGHAVSKMRTGTWRKPGTVVRLIFILPILVASPASKTYAAVNFEASGRCVTTSWRPNGLRMEPLEFRFRVRVTEPIWSIRVEDLSALAGKRASADFEELFCDGTDLYQIGHCPEAIRTNLATRFRFNTFGSVRPATFPAFATPLERILWLGFCSGQYPPLSATNFPQIDNLFMPSNVAAVSAGYFPTAPHIPNRVQVWAKGALVADPKSPGGMRVIRPIGSSDEGYLAFTFESGSPTNAAGEAIVPQDLKATYYGLDLSAEHPKPFRATEIVMTVQRLGPAQEALAPPELVGVANVLDARYTNKFGLAFRYMETNGGWVSRTDPTPTKTLETKSRVPIYKKGGGAVRRHALKCLLGLSLGGPIIIYGMISLTRRRAKHTENNQQTGDHV
jgi:hypothetical protein